MLEVPEKRMGIWDWHVCLISFFRGLLEMLFILFFFGLVFVSLLLRVRKIFVKLSTYISLCTKQSENVLILVTLLQISTFPSNKMLFSYPKKIKYKVGISITLGVILVCSGQSLSCSQSIEMLLR